MSCPVTCYRIRRIFAYKSTPRRKPAQPNTSFAFYFQVKLIVKLARLRCSCHLGRKTHASRASHASIRHHIRLAPSLLLSSFLPSRGGRASATSAIFAGRGGATGKGLKADLANHDRDPRPRAGRGSRLASACNARFDVSNDTTDVVRRPRPPGLVTSAFCWADRLTRPVLGEHLLTRPAGSACRGMA